jgi:hypothetical protein
MFRSKTYLFQQRRIDKTEAKDHKTNTKKGQKTKIKMLAV